MSQGGVIWCLPHTRALLHSHTQLQSLEGDGDMRLCCTLRVKSRISWRLFIMHKVPSGKELEESQQGRATGGWGWGGPVKGPAKLLTQFVSSGHTHTHTHSHSLTPMPKTPETYVCKPRRRVNCLWGAHYSAVIRQMANAIRQDSRMRTRRRNGQSCGFGKQLGS